MTWQLVTLILGLAALTIVAVAVLSSLLILRDEAGKSHRRRNVVRSLERPPGRPSTWSG